MKEFRETYRKKEDGTMELVSSVEIVSKPTEYEIPEGMLEQAELSTSQRNSGLDYEGQEVNSLKGE